MPVQRVRKITNVVSGRLITLEQMLNTFRNIGLSHDFRLSIPELSHVLVTKQLPPGMPKRRKRFPLVEIVASAAADYEQETGQRVNGQILGRYGWQRAEIDCKVREYLVKPRLKIAAKKHEEESKPIDPLRHYQSEIGRYPLLKPEEERQLAARVRQGDIQARNEMIERNLRLVVSISGAYTGRGLSRDELISHGNEGLLKAVERYNLFEGTKFSTYATWWIKQTIRRGILNDAKTVRTPSYMAEMIGKVRKLQHEHYAMAGRNLYADEICGITGYKPDEVKRILKSGKNGNAPLYEEGHACNADESGRYDKNEKWAKVKAEMAKLSARERMILEKRFADEPQTFEKIGEEIGVTRERVRQIEAKALKALMIGCGAMTEREYMRLMQGKPRYRRM